jgi:alkylhydroperoxidase family enzyme
VIADPRAVAARWPEPRYRVLAELACVTTEEPWSLSRAHHERARTAGLTDDEVLHALALAAFFGHLNRVADAVDVPLDYRVRREPPRLERAVPPFERAPAPVTGSPALDLARREPTTAAFAAWKDYLARPSAALDGSRRALIASRVGDLLGHPATAASPRPDALGAAERALLELADRITLAPWTFDAAAYTPLRGAGFTDRDLFDACVVASSAGVFSRLDVALIALGR